MHADDFGDVPVLVVRADRPQGTILLLHGQGADALTNAKELNLLAGAGFHAVGVDAPSHGRRYDPDRDSRWARDQHAALRHHVHQAAAELPAILDHCEQRGLHGPFGITGISLGAFTLWRALANEPRLKVAVPILGSPALLGEPVPDPRVWIGRKILAQSAEHDEIVPNGPTQQVIAAIGGHYHNIAASPHRIPELQWWSVWGRAVRFFSEELPTSSSDGLETKGNRSTPSRGL